MKKIMFNDQYALTEAVLEGRKTMTRRLVPIVKSVDDIYWGIDDKGMAMIPYKVFLFESWVTIDIYPRYQVGEVVAIAQSYGHIFGGEPSERLTVEFSDWFVKQKGLNETKGWSNKMFVKATLMPHHIRITDVKVERLQDISEEDCLREGIEEHLKGVQYGHPANQYCGQFPFSTPRAAFAALIDKVSGKGTWKGNPWVFVYEFELID